MTGDAPIDESTVVGETAAYLDEDAEELYEHAPAGYLSMLPSGLIVKANETLLSWTGHSRADVVGNLRLHDLLAPGARIYYETHYAPLLELQGSVREIAVELLRADGGRLPVLLSSTLVRDASGTPRVVRTTVFDARDRRRYERELQRARTDAETRARATLALEHVNDGVLLVDADGRVDVVNPAAEAILGISAETAVGRPAAEAIPGWAAIVAHASVADPGQPVGPGLVPVGPGAHEQWLAVAGVETGDGIVYTIRDVTSEHELEQLRADLVAIVSHELRTPLTGVYGSAQTLLARYEALDDATRRQLLGLIVEQGERLTRILDQILLTSRLDTGNVAVERQAFDAPALAESVRDALPEAERARVTVAADADVRADGDAGTTRQILTNVLDNALKYTDGPVRLGVATSAPYVRFTVADEGPGIPPAERERVFEKFYRLDPGQQRGVGGTGLGLYIARQLAERMDGRVGLLPRDDGTTVFVDLPAAAG